MRNPSIALRVLLRAATLLFLLFAWLGLHTSRTFGAPDPEPCSANSESRQLDFWLGEWTISNAGAPQPASARFIYHWENARSWKAGKTPQGMQGKTGLPTTMSTKAGWACLQTIAAMFTFLWTEKYYQAPQNFMDPSAVRMAKQFST